MNLEKKKKNLSKLNTFLKKKMLFLAILNVFIGNLCYSHNGPVWLTCLPACTHSTRMSHYEAMLNVSSVLPSFSLCSPLTHMSLNLGTDTESQRYYSWNACYVFSTNERMKKNKQRGPN